MNKTILMSTMTVCLILAGCAKESMPQQIGQSLSAPTITSNEAPSESAASSASAILNGATSPAQLKSILAKYTPDQIEFFQCLTIGDRQNAAFAIVQGGDVWYITASGAQILKSNIAYQVDNKFNAPLLWMVDNTKIFKCESSAGGSSSTSYAWYVKDGKPIELPYTGMGLFYSGNGQFTTIGDKFDAGFIDGIGAGHTYKLYYLYWTAIGLKEYGGLKITQLQLLKVKGAREIIDTITGQGYIIDEIYYRANHLININYHTGDKRNGDFDNVTLVYKNSTVTPELAYADLNNSKTKSFNGRNLSAYSYGGIYQAALFPQIATYPDKFLEN